MANENNATETNASAIAPKEEVKSVIIEDLEAKNAELEAEKAKLIEEGSNYKVAYLKEKQKNSNADETDDERMERIAHKAVANSRLAEIAREQDALIKKVLRERKELILAAQNKTDIPASIGTHSESQPVRDTLVTPDQLAAFKARGWSDKQIEQYKKNLVRYAR